MSKYYSEKEYEEYIAKVKKANAKIVRAQKEGRLLKSRNKIAPSLNAVRSREEYEERLARVNKVLERGYNRKYNEGAAKGMRLSIERIIGDTANYESVSKILDKLKPSQIEELYERTTMDFDLPYDMEQLDYGNVYGDDWHESQAMVFTNDLYQYFNELESREKATETLFKRNAKELNKTITEFNKTQKAREELAKERQPYIDILEEYNESAETINKFMMGDNTITREEIVQAYGTIQSMQPEVQYASAMLQTSELQAQKYGMQLEKIEKRKAELEKEKRRINRLNKKMDSVYENLKFLKSSKAEINELLKEFY